MHRLIDLDIRLQDVNYPLLLLLLLLRLLQNLLRLDGWRKALHYGRRRELGDSQGFLGSHEEHPLMGPGGVGRHRADDGRYLHHDPALPLF